MSPDTTTGTAPVGAGSCRARPAPCHAPFNDSKRRSRGIRLTVAVLALVIALTGVGTSVPASSARILPITVKKQTRLAQVWYIDHGLTVQPPHKKRENGKRKMSLYTRYFLETKSGQRASIRFKDGTTLHMNQRTDAVLSSPHLTYANGEVYETLAPGTNHKVQTATALAAAIGTQFDVRLVKGVSQFIVVHGTLQVKGKKGKAVYVHANQSSVVPPNQPAQQPQPINARQATGWTSGMPTPNLGDNVALHDNGGHVVAFSSQYSSPSQGRFWDVKYIIDGSLDYGWESGSGNVTNQWVKIGFYHNKTYRLTKVIIDPAATHGDPSSADLKDFQIRVSTTGTADSDFTTVLTGTTAQQNSLQTFWFKNPMDAKYIELYALNNYGNPDWIAVAEFEAVTAAG